MQVNLINGVGIKAMINSTVARSYICPKVIYGDLREEKVDSKPRYSQIKVQDGYLTSNRVANVSVSLEEGPMLNFDFAVINTPLDEIEIILGDDFLQRHNVNLELFETKDSSEDMSRTERKREDETTCQMVQGKEEIKKESAGLITCDSLDGLEEGLDSSEVEGLGMTEKLGVRSAGKLGKPVPLVLVEVINLSTENQVLQGETGIVECDDAEVYKEIIVPMDEEATPSIFRDVVTEESNFLQEKQITMNSLKKNAEMLLKMMEEENEQVPVEEKRAKLKTAIGEFVEKLQNLVGEKKVSQLQSTLELDVEEVDERKVPMTTEAESDLEASIKEMGTSYAPMVTKGTSSLETVDETYEDVKVAVATGQEDPMVTVARTDLEASIKELGTSYVPMVTKGTNSLETVAEILEEVVVAVATGQEDPMVTMEEESMETQQNDVTLDKDIQYKPTRVAKKPSNPVLDLEEKVDKRRHAEELEATRKERRQTEEVRQYRKL